MRFKPVLILILLACLTTSAMGRSFYVRRAGSDQNTGTSWSSAWATVNKVNSSISTGDTVRFGVGIYYASRFTPPTNADFGDRTVYACSSWATVGDPDGSETWLDPIICSGESITNAWTVYSGNIWRVSWNGGATHGNSWNATTCQDWQLLHNSIHNTLAEVDHEGTCFYDPTNQLLYAWLYNNENPNNCLMVSTRQECVRLDQAKHILFMGLDLRMGAQGVVLSTSDDHGDNDSVYFAHCNLTRQSWNMVSMNGSIIVHTNVSVWSRYYVFQACSLGISNDGGTNFYDISPVIFDSCTIYDCYYGGIYFKMGYAGGMNTGSVIKYCTFDNYDFGYDRTGHEALQFYRKTDRDSVYGCIFKNYDERAIAINTGQDMAFDAHGELFIGNNTFYKCNQIIFCNYADSVGGNEIKYNIGYDFASGTNWQYIYRQPLNHMEFDNNYWYDLTVSFSAYDNQSTYNWSQWRAHGQDANSYNSNPNLTDPANGDFSRPGASQEMDVTYGGKRWTVFGAWQPEGDPPPPSISQYITETSTQNSASLIDNLYGGTAPYDSLVLHWSTSRANVVNLSARDTRATNTPSPYTFNKSSLTPSTKYYFRILAFDTGVIGDTTAIDSVTTTAIPGIDQSISKTSTQNSASLTDNLSNGSAPYDSLVLHWSTVRANVANLTARDIRATGASDPYTFVKSSLDQDTKYYFRILAYDTGALGDTTAIDSVTTTIPGLGLISLNVPDTVSGTYPGYDSAQVNNGVINPRGGTATTWASDQSTNSHWVVINFITPKIVRRAIMYWAWNSSNSSWMCSRQYIFQYWNSATNSYQDITTINNSAADSTTTTDFSPVTTIKIRYWQPANMGPSNYPTIVWLTEFELYGSNADGDTIPPAAIDDLGAIPGNDDGEIILNWTAPGDDGNVGQAADYDIRYSIAPIDEDNWGEADECPSPPSPASPGQTQSYTISGLAEGEVYYVAMVAHDDVGWESDLSNVVDTFSAGIAAPIQVTTDVDSANSSVTVVAEIVESYLSLFYVFELDSLDTYPEPELNLDLSADTVAMASFDSLSDNQTYFWRVCAVASDGSDTSSWSPSIPFNTLTGITSALTSADCVYPLPNDYVHAAQPFFEIRNLLEISTYYFEVDNNVQFSNPIQSGPIPKSSGTTTNWQVVDPLEAGGVYYWRVSSNGMIWTSPLAFTAILDIHPYPNPFKPSLGHTAITFTNLVAVSDVTISTISGQIVLREDGLGPADWVWNVKNSRGEDLAPGVYLYNINFPSGSANGKLLIVR